MTDTTTKGAMITSPATTLGERGRPNLRDPARTGSDVGPASGGTWARDVLLIVMASGHLPRARIDQHVHHIGEKVGEQHHQGDDHEDPLNEGVIELAERVVEVVADTGVVENDLDEALAGDHQADGNCEVGDDGQERVARG